MADRSIVNWHNFHKKPRDEFETMEQDVAL